eukprot:COSAG06_NODE_13493_length_1252_cov_1.349523_2_plen_65_part_00
MRLQSGTAQLRKTLMSDASPSARPISCVPVFVSALTIPILKTHTHTQAHAKAQTQMQMQLSLDA